jgi:hypothetical protein
VAEEGIAVQRRFVHGSLLAFVVAVPLGAQTVRGTIIDESTKLPVSEVQITLVESNGTRILPGVRSDSLGNFVVHASRPGTYRVSASRIGYRALQSDRIELSLGQVAIVRLRMTTVAQQLVPVTIVERRALKLDELMSTAGFDLRESKGVGRFLNAEQLVEYGLEGAGEVLRSYLWPNVEIADSASGAFMFMRPKLWETCAPEVYLDGSSLSGPGDPIGRRQSAFAMLEAFPAKELHGVEVYRANQIPPPSLGGVFGTSPGIDATGSAGIPPKCGVVAVWTKNGILRRALAARRGGRSDEMQVIRGVVVNFDTGKPVPGVPITLLNEARDDLADPVHSDSVGEFIIRTNRFGTLRLGAGSIGYRPSTSEVFTVDPRELVLVKLFVSGTQPVLAPFGIAARLKPENLAIAALAGFAYRRERGIGGTYLGPEELQRIGAPSLLAVFRTIEGVVVTGTPPASTIAMRTTANNALASCVPTMLLDGVRVPAAAIDSTVATLPLSRVFGIEAYAPTMELPAVFADIAGACGLIGVWTRRD